MSERDPAILGLINLTLYSLVVSFSVQWNLSNLDTLGTEESVLISEVS